MRMHSEPCLLSPTPCKPADFRLTAQKLEWLYASLTVLKRESDRIGDEDCLRISVQRKRMLEVRPETSEVKPSTILFEEATSSWSPLSSGGLARFCSHEV